MLPADAEPDRDCPLCPRLADFRQEWRRREPLWHNAPVRTFLPPEGPSGVRLLVVGLAPGLRGANRTGRPFTGDYAGDLLYRTMIRYRLARGTYGADPQDGLELAGAAITNAVRCVPPQNKPEGSEISNCRRFLAATIASMPDLTVIVTLGVIAHQSTLRALGLTVSRHPFRHGGEYEAGRLALFSSYHCSRYNTNTGVLTEPMFMQVFEAAAAKARA